MMMMGTNGRGTAPSGARRSSKIDNTAEVNKAAAVQNFRDPPGSLFLEKRHPGFITIKMSIHILLLM